MEKKKLGRQCLAASFVLPFLFILLGVSNYFLFHRINEMEEIDILIFSVIAFVSLAIVIVSTFFAIRGKHQLYWISALGIYIFSFIAGFSIGQLTVGLVFLPLALAIGHSFGLIKKKKHSISFVALGILIGFLMVIYVRNGLFYLLFLLFNY